MKKTYIKIAIGFLAPIIGIAAIWMIGIYHVLFPVSVNVSESMPETSSSQRPMRAKSGKVLIHLNGFEYRKDWVANFEITNDTPEPMFYVGGESKDQLDYCTLAAKHQEQDGNLSSKKDNLSIEVRDICYYGTFLKLQTLNPGESIVLTVDEGEVRGLLHISDPNLDTTAQAGFEVFAGNDRSRQILWSDEITFPHDEYRH